MSPDVPVLFLPRNKIGEFIILKHQENENRTIPNRLGDAPEN